MPKFVLWSAMEEESWDTQERKMRCPEAVDVGNRHLRGLIVLVQ